MELQHPYIMRPLKTGGNFFKVEKIFIHFLLLEEKRISNVLTSIEGSSFTPCRGYWFLSLFQFFQLQLKRQFFLVSQALSFLTGFPFHSLIPETLGTLTLTNQLKVEAVLHLQAPTLHQSSTL